MSVNCCSCSDSASFISCWCWWNWSRDERCWKLRWQHAS